MQTGRSPLASCLLYGFMGVCAMWGIMCLLTACLCGDSRMSLHVASFTASVLVLLQCAVIGWLSFKGK